MTTQPLTTASPSPTTPCGTPTNVTGQLLSKRHLSHRLCFADLQLSDTKEVIELVLKIDQEMTATTPRHLKHVCVGDAITAQGHWEVQKDNQHHRSFRCSQEPTVDTAWKTANPTNAFAPVYFDRSMYFTTTTTTTTPTTMCKFFTSTLSCPKGDHCPYIHTTDTKLRHEWVQNRRKRKRERQQLSGDTIVNVHQKVSKCARADVFANWIVSTFGGASKLSQGSGVLDVAGGRGDMNFELAFVRNVTCTTIDPRPSKPSKKQRKWVKRQNKLRKKQKTTPERNNGQSQNNQPLAQKEQQHVQDLFDDAFVDKHVNLLSDCSLIIGMHPDEATESIVDVAIQNKKPFAIVPCCVFPKSGQSMPLDQWYRHLKAKSKCVKETFLNFQGRNKVLYVDSYVEDLGEGEAGEEKI